MGFNKKNFRPCTFQIRSSFTCFGLLVHVWFIEQVYIVLLMVSYIVFILSTSCSPTNFVLFTARCFDQIHIDNNIFITDLSTMSRVSRTRSSLLWSRNGLPYSSSVVTSHSRPLLVWHTTGVHDALIFQGHKWQVPSLAGWLSTSADQHIHHHHSQHSQLLYETA